MVPTEAAGCQFAFRASILSPDRNAIFPLRHPVSGYRGSIRKGLKENLDSRLKMSGMTRKGQAPSVLHPHTYAQRCINTQAQFVSGDPSWPQAETVTWIPDKGCRESTSGGTCSASPPPSHSFPWRAGTQRGVAVPDRPRRGRPGTEPRQWRRRSLLGLHAGPHELGPITQTRLRHRHYHLSTMRRAIDHPRGDRRSHRDHQDSGPPGPTPPRPTTSPSPPRRIHANSLIPPRIPVRYPNRHSPFARFHPTRHEQATDLA